RQSFSVMEWVKNAVKQEHVTTVQGLLNTPPAKNNKDTVLVVEHANKLGVDDTRALMQKAKADGSKLIFLNHTAASKGFKAGHAVDTLQKGNVYSTEWKNAKPSNTAVLIHEAEKAPRQQDIALKYAALSNEERSQTQVLATNQTDSKHLNTLIRDTLDKQGQLSEKRLEIDTLNPVFMSKEQQTMAKSYKAGMVLTEFGNGKRQRFTVTNVLDGANSLQLVNEQGEKSSVNMDSKRSFMVASPAKLEIARGDKLQVNANVFGTELKQNDSMTVEKINWLGVQFKSDDGSRHVVTKEQLHQSALTYGYANTISQAKSDKAVTLVDMTSFTASKETLHDLLSTDTKQLHFFTENSSKLEHKLDKSNIQPTAISRVLHADNAIEKYVNAQTSKALLNDVSIALNNIGERHIDKGIVHDAVQFALNHISEQKAGFTHTELVTQAMTYATEERGIPIQQHEIKQQLDTLEKNGTVFSAEYHDQTRWTTKESLETEQRILNTIAEGKDTQAPLVTEKVARDFLATQTRMTDGQKDSITLITTTKDQFVGIQGFAGTGKSTMLEQGISLVNMAQTLFDDKTQFIGLAPTHAAVNELKDKGVKSQTTQSLLQDYKTGALEPSRLSNTVFLLDESSMSSNKQLDSFTELAKESGARVVMLGDIHQLQSKEAGKPFELAFSKKVMQTTVMKDIVRQQNEPTLNAVKHVIDKQVHSTLDALKEQLPLPVEQYLPDTKQPKDEIDQKPTSINKSQNVISTFETVTGDYKKDSILATEKLYVEATAEYLSRTPESRANTLVIAYSHRERDLLAGMIREGLQKTNELSTDEQQVTRLRSVGATQESLKTMMPYKKGIVINTGKEDYFEISHVNKAHQFLEVVNMHTGESSVFIPKHHDHSMTTLWNKDNKPLAIGDEITWRKTDKSLALQGNTELTVTALDNKTMTVTSTNGKEIPLPRDNMQSSHWDYRYTRTADMAQGATFKNVITVVDANAKLTNIRRGYIDISRASEHVKLFTNHESSLIKSWINNKDDNTSAIETLEKPDMHHT
ncbi:conjugative transfer relaxase/helicase TraI, partial [Shewanella sairae]|uniref:conjugative transfer relaxase/helicase TraI n=2 Tax=Shewanella sairae TaxID=190310 RepID=UPI001C7EC608